MICPRLTSTLTLLAACSVAAFTVATAAPPTTAPATAPASPISALTLPRLDGTPQPMSAYAGKVLLIVNTASKCGFTKQYAGLQKLHEAHAAAGLAVLGFPSDDFNGQEFDTSGEIAAFCKDRYGVSFDLFEKLDVTGDAPSPLFKYLTSADALGADAGEVKWNFEKFLVGRDGKVVKRFRSKVAPDDPELTKAIEAELAN